jgi:hypothetical protein
MDELPTTATNKVLRRGLAAQGVAEGPGVYRWDPATQSYRGTA